MDTNEALVIFKPESYKEPKLYNEILKRLKGRFKIRAMWPKIADIESLRTFSLSDEYVGAKFLCTIVQSIDKSSTLEVVKEVIGRVSDPKKCMLGSIRRDLGGDQDLLLYSTTVDEVVTQIGIWRPIFITAVQDGYGDGYGKS